MLDQQNPKVGGQGDVASLLQVLLVHLLHVLHARVEHLGPQAPEK
jgi:hypothetical protein